MKTKDHKNEYVLTEYISTHCKFVSRLAPVGQRKKGDEPKGREGSWIKVILCAV